MSEGEPTTIPASMADSVNVWLSDEMTKLWIKTNQKTPVYVFSSMMAWNIIGVLTLLLLKGRYLNTERAKEQLHRGSAALLHVLAAGAAAVYLLNHPASCINDLFCHNQLYSRIMDIQAGYLLFEVLFYTNKAKYVQPTYRWTIVHHTFMLSIFVIFKVYPCSLTLKLLPFQLILVSFDLVDALKDTAIAMKARQSVRIAFMRLLAPAMLLKAAGALGIAIYARTYIYDNAINQLILNNERDMLTTPYVWTVIISCWVTTALYFFWLHQGVEISQQVDAELGRLEVLSRQAPLKGTGSVPKNNKKKKKAQRA